MLQAISCPAPRRHGIVIRPYLSIRATGHIELDDFDHFPFSAPVASIGNPSRWAWFDSLRDTRMQGLELSHC
ncbi:hypothetical protein HYQ46_003525 [Verticillium longisporum]|nr:hypothetical protein HYQ46_003525 [Verticillium longisporum]